MTDITTENQPIACTLAEGDFRERLAWIATLTREALRSHDRDNFVLHLRYAPEAASRVREMMRKEQACCAFLTFEMHKHPDEVRLTIRAPEDAHANADPLFEPFVAAAAPVVAPTFRLATAAFLACPRLPAFLDQKPNDCE